MYLISVSTVLSHLDISLYTGYTTNHLSLIDLFTNVCFSLYLSNYFSSVLALHLLYFTLLLIYTVITALLVYVITILTVTILCSICYVAMYLDSHITAPIDI